MPASGVGFAVLEIIIFILAVALFAYNTWYKIQLVRQGQPEWEKRWDRIPQRIKTFIIEVIGHKKQFRDLYACLLYTSPSPRDGLLSRMPSSA